MTQDKIIVAMCSDERGADFMQVAIKSLFYNNRNEDIELHIITDGFTEATMSQLAQIEQIYDCRIDVHTISTTIFDDVPGAGEDCEFPKGALFRLMIPSLLAVLSRIIYLDTDVVVCNCLRELWNTPLEGYAMAAVNDASEFTSENMEYFRDFLGFNAGEYVNSGVLLMDLDYFRRENVSNRCINWLVANPDKSKYPDQNALNVILRGKIKLLHEKYNLIQGWYKPMLGTNAVVHTPTVDEARNNPVIIHFTLHKPWIKYGIPKFPPNKEVFEKYRDLPPKTKMRTRPKFDNHITRRRVYHLLYQLRICKRLPSLWSNFYGLDSGII